MAGVWWLVAIVGSGAVVLAGWAWSRWWKRRPATDLVRARRLFHLRREWLEARFIRAASESGKPRGVSWEHCEFADEAAFATDRSTGQLRAFVAATVRFEAVPGEELEGNPNLDDLKAATAVFLFDGHDWVSEGRAVFNLNPLETIEQFRHELQLVE